jgi:hypothetical protein
MVFMRQCISSDYCGVYSSAMLCALFGHPVSKRRALAAFGGRREIRRSGGVTLEAMAAFVERFAPVASVEWCRPRSATQAGVTRLVSRNAPTLLMFRARLLGVGVEAYHVVVATRAKDDEVRLLDPLAPPPRAGQRHNATWKPTSAVIAGRYTILLSKPLYVLRLRGVSRSRGC